MGHNFRTALPPGTPTVSFIVYDHIGVKSEYSVTLTISKTLEDIIETSSTESKESTGTDSIPGFSFVNISIVLMVVTLFLRKKKKK